LRAIITLLLLILLLLTAPRLWALEPDYSRNSFDAMVERVRSADPPRPVAAKFTYPQAEAKKSPKSRTPLERRSLSMGPPLSPLTMRTGDLKPLTVSTSSRKASVELPPKGQVDSSAPPRDGLSVTPKILKSAVFSATPNDMKKLSRPGVKAKAMLCVDCLSNEVRLAENSSFPLPIASITKLLTAMTVIDEMDLEKVLEVPKDIKGVERHVVGIKPGDMISVKDLLYGLLVASGNDCAEVLARAYPKGGRKGFMAAMNSRAGQIGATNTTIFTPSGLDMKVGGEGKIASDPTSRMANTASAEDVALIARRAFSYPLISKVSSTKTYTMRTRNPKPREYRLASNDKLLHRGLPIAGAKTGYTDAAGKCIVALFRDQKKEHLVVLLNTPKHFTAAERIYRWASRNF